MNKFRGLIGCITAVAMSTSTAIAAEQELNINVIASMSGTFADFGVQAEKGAKLAIEEAGEASGVKLKMTLIDSESNAGKAAQKVQASLSENGPGLYVGSTLSSTALAVGKLIGESGGVYFTGSGDDSITGAACNQSMYRWTVPTYGAVNSSLRPVLEANPDIKKIYTVTPNYVFGEAMLENVKKVAQEKGLELVGNSEHSLQDMEFSGIIAQIQAAQPDLLVLLNFGAQSQAMIQQAVNFGLKDQMKILLVWSQGLDQMQALGSDVVAGIYFGAQYWHEEEAPASKALNDLTMAKLGEPANYPMASYYQMTKLLIDAVAAVHSTDPAKTREYLNGLEYEGITGSEKVSAKNHQVEKSFYLLLGKGKADMADAFDFADVVDKSKYFLSAEELGCDLQ